MSEDPVWPGDLPQRPLVAGYSAKPLSNVIGSQMGTGPPKTRRRATVALETRTLSYRLTSAQRDSWLAFFHGVIGSGSLAFLWPDPEANLTLRRVQIHGGEPGRAPRGAGRWTLTLGLLILPG